MSLRSVHRLSAVALLLICALGAQLLVATPTAFLTLPFGNPEIVITEGWFYDDLTPHHGIDYAVGAPSVSFPVLAANRGGAVVVLDDASNSSGYGNFVLIKHDEFDSSGFAYFTLYAHLRSATWPASFKVKTISELRTDIANDNYSDWVSVNRGEQIGLSGDTGLAEGIHLHFEVERGGYALNKTDPYDIYNIRNFYPAPCQPDSSSSGVPQPDPGVLWSNCPPVLPSTGANGGSSGSTAIITGTVNGKTVDKAYVPLTFEQSVSVLNADSTTDTGAFISSIPMPAGFTPNATAADQGTQQVVVISYNSPDIQIIDASHDTSPVTYTSPVTQFASFSGGSCMICGVLIDPSTNSAILDTAQGYSLLNLANGSFSPFIQSTVAGENFGYNQNSKIILNPTYSQGIGSGLQAINLGDQSVRLFDSTVGSFPDAAAFDTSTNIAVIPDEFTGNQYLINMGQSVFSSGQFSAPSTVFPLNFTACGGELHDWSLVSVESSNHLLFLGTEFADCAAVETMPTAGVSGAPPNPAVFHWGHMPTPDGVTWNNGADPHGIAVFTSVVDGRAYGFLIRSDKEWVARIDMAGVRNASLKAGGGTDEVDLTPFVSFLKTRP